MLALLPTLPAVSLPAQPCLPPCFSLYLLAPPFLAGVPQKSACMAVVVQQQMSPDLCFVLHTRHPGKQAEGRCQQGRMDQAQDQAAAGQGTRAAAQALPLLHQRCSDACRRAAIQTIASSPPPHHTTPHCPITPRLQ